MQPAVFLDRDNTLIATDGDLGDPEQVQLLPGVPEGLLALREAGYRLVVVTNQPGVARGLLSETEVDFIHQRIAAMIDQASQTHDLIDRFYYCPYCPDATIAEYRRDHPWRKPHPGMILQASRDLRLDLGRSWLIGDQTRDIAAGRSAGCRTILINHNGHTARANEPNAKPTTAVRSFLDAVDHILQSSASSAVRSSAPVESTPAFDPEEPALRTEVAQLRRGMTDLADELRAERARKTDFTLLKMAAGICQLLVLLLVLLGLLQLAQGDVFYKWMIGAILAQLATITILLADRQS